MSFIEAALLARSHKLENVTITFFIAARNGLTTCGTGTGITASGRRVTPYVSCAVTKASSHWAAPS